MNSIFPRPQVASTSKGNVMSRSGYSDDLDHWTLISWRGAVASAIRGKRGQQFLIEMRDALDAMPDKRLVDSELEKDGEVCALGAVARLRGLPVGDMDPDDYSTVAGTFGISEALAREIVDANDEYTWGANATPEARWKYMRDWVERQIAKVTP